MIDLYTHEYMVYPVTVKNSIDNKHWIFLRFRANINCRSLSIQSFKVIELCVCVL